MDSTTDRDRTARLAAMVVAKPVLTWLQACVVRRIRNTGYESLFDQTWISVAAQRRWWNQRSADDRLWLITQHDSEADIGFMYLRPTGERSNRWYITLVVLPNWRGRGYGTAIYRLAPRLVPHGKVLAAMWSGNVASRAAAEAAGYQRIFDDVYAVDGKVVLQSP